MTIHSAVKGMFQSKAFVNIKTGSANYTNINELSRSSTNELIFLLHIHIHSVVARLGGSQKSQSFCPRKKNLFNLGIETGTMSALHPQEMPPAPIRRLLTIDTRYSNDFGMLCRKRLGFDTDRNRLPSGRHSFRSFCGLFANRTARVVGAEIFETLPMNGVATGHLVRSDPTCKQVFLAYGTARHVFPGLAVMVCVKDAVDAHAAVVTVFKVLSTTDATKAASVTMVWVIIHRHP